MKQLMQKLRDGTMKVLDTSIPTLGDGAVLVQNHFSLISAGTEGGTVTAARKSLVGKAKERPEQVRQVLDSLRHQGVLQTYRAVSKKLDSYSALGYSCAGIVIDAGRGVRGIAIGDRVACAGMGYACHAEVVSVPENLCVRLDPDSNLMHAAYNTLGAIALQGVRQADVRLGETCVVIGLGLLGQLTSLLLKAAGVRVVGLDINSAAIDTAKSHCVDDAYLINDVSIQSAVARATNGVNADAVIITAATDSTLPVNLAGKLLRKRGTVVVVGDVPTGFQREPDYYRKELTLKMSCSYGPGRYDLNYEEKGYDYPPAYVRWTENRNMQAFQSFLQSGEIDLSYMTTHRFSIDDAPKAYDLIVNKSEKYLGILIEYDASKVHSRRQVSILANPEQRRIDGSGIAFVGAGSYAQSHLLPNIPKDAGTRFTGVMTSSGTSARSVAEKYGFHFVASSVEEILNDENTSTVFIATRHDTHAGYVQAALRAGKNVFVEKPLCLSPAELDTIVDAWSTSQPRLMVGFNRRFSPFARQIKSAIGTGPVSVVYRINAGAIPPDSWIQDSDIGGGRIVGEICHFIDLTTYFSGSPPIRVHAEALGDAHGLNDTVVITLAYANGSIGSICYFANGAKAVPKEYIEVYKDGVTAMLVDFRTLKIHGSRTSKSKRSINQDKGQQTMVAAFLESIRAGADSPIPIQEVLSTTRASFAALDSLRLKQPVDIISAN